MKTTFLYLILFLAHTTTITAQNLSFPSHSNHITHDYIGTNLAPETIIHYLSQKLPHTHNKHIIWTNTLIQHQPFADHYTFEQQYQGQKLYGSHLKITIDKKGYIVSINNNSFSVNEIQLPTPTKLSTTQWNTKYLQDFLLQKKAIEKTREKLCLLDNEQKLHFAYLIYAQDQQEVANITAYLFAENGHLYHSQDIAHYHHLHHQQNSTTLATAMVFDPDPLTTAQKNYGQNNQYKDRNDQDATELNAQRHQVNIEVTEEDGMYSLKNNFIEIKELGSQPNIAPIKNPTPNFDYLRSNDAFEDVNAYYHTNVMREYVNSLGFQNMTQQKLLIDTHALNGEDQSKYVFYGFERQLYFGEGGVDDAEDADVVVHEYGHYLSDLACPGCNSDCGSNTERSALDEALCDYLATSYSRRNHDFNWENMFSWDGHNEFWVGRNMDNDKHYPENITTSYYQTSEIFSAAMMDIWEVLGYETTDKILLAAMYNFTACMNLAEAAEQIMLSDQLLYNGQHEAVLYQLLSGRGLLNYRRPNAGNDTTVCLGKSLTLGESIIAPADAELFWSPGLTLNDSTTAYPIANPDQTTQYIVTLRNPSTNLTYTDTIVVQVNYCLTSPVDTIQLLNTDRFLKGRGDLVVSLPTNTTQATLAFYNISGQLLQMLTYENPSEYLMFNGDTMPAGVYILHIKADNVTRVFKVAKAR